MTDKEACWVVTKREGARGSVLGVGHGDVTKLRGVGRFTGGMMKSRETMRQCRRANDHILSRTVGVICADLFTLVVPSGQN
jgi:hypothetical protein